MSLRHSLHPKHITVVGKFAADVLIDSYHAISAHMRHVSLPPASVIITFYYGKSIGSICLIICKPTQHSECRQSPHLDTSFMCLLVMIMHKQSTERSCGRSQSVRHTARWFQQPESYGILVTAEDKPLVP